jgi:hypothetical protein
VQAEEDVGAVLAGNLFVEEDVGSSLSIRRA